MAGHGNAIVINAARLLSTGAPKNGPLFGALRTNPWRNSPLQIPKDYLGAASALRYERYKLRRTEQNGNVRRAAIGALFCGSHLARLWVA